MSVRGASGVASKVSRFGISADRLLGMRCRLYSLCHRPQRLARLVAESWRRRPVRDVLGLPVVDLSAGSKMVIANLRRLRLADVWVGVFPVSQRTGLVRSISLDPIGSCLAGAWF